MSYDKEEPVKRKLVSIEDIVTALASQCDGARSRDGRGFNRGDAQEGGRLASLLRNGISWTVADAERAIELTSRYSNQAGKILGDGRDSKSTGITKAIKSGRVQLENEPTTEQQPYNYACFSPGAKHVYFWKIAWLNNIADLNSDIKTVATHVRHGDRKIYVKGWEKSYITINGKRREVPRLRIDFNGSTQKYIQRICEKHDFIFEPAIANPIDKDIDEVRKKLRSAWTQTATRNGIQGNWAVFDLHEKNEAFSSAVKTRMKGKFCCDPADDWNWFLMWNDETIHTIQNLVAEFNFTATREIIKGVS